MKKPDIALALMGSASPLAAFYCDADRLRGPGLCVNGHIAQGGGGGSLSALEIGDNIETASGLDPLIADTDDNPGTNQLAAGPKRVLPPS